MTAIILFALYSILILFEALLLYRILGTELELGFIPMLMDTIVVNMISLVLIIVFFGLSLAKIDATGTQIHFFKVMMLTWPQEIMKINLFSIVSDSIALAIWYRYRFPERNTLAIAAKGALMNVPALILTGMTWAFVTIMAEFFSFLRIT